MPPDPVVAVHDAVRAALAHHEGIVLAVSGGRDSMALLDAAASVAPRAVAAVATFDHGTGAWARRAVAVVRRASRERGLRVIAGRGADLAASESAWRDARWSFLRAAARERGVAAIATAHTGDDQLETVAMRVLRSAGARGLAGLCAPQPAGSPTAPALVRPLLGVGRAEVDAYVAARRVPFVDDPGNRDGRFLRVRLRHELLPALRRVDPALAADLLRVGRAAAAWRADVDALVDRGGLVVRDAGGGARVVRAALEGYDAESLAVLWPAIAARAGVRLDRRGTRRLVAFTTRTAAGAASGAAIQLSGGIEVVARRGELVFRRTAPRPGRRSATGGRAEARPLDGDVRVGVWELRRVDRDTGSQWSATLPAGLPLTVRAWQPGDRMRAAGAASARRVKRFLAEAGVPAVERVGWPVVLAAGEIVWIPGVRRSDAATDRPGTPGQRYICGRHDA